MKRGLLAMAVLVSFTLALGPPVLAADDISQHWAKNDIIFLWQMGIYDWLDGPGGEPAFRPDQPITRADFAVWLCRVFDVAPVEGASFPDLEGVPERGYIEAAATLGLIRGLPDGRFAPGDSINRAAVATLLARFYGLIMESPTTFPDVPASHWAAREIRRAAATGLFEGDNKGDFRPAATITRAEAATVLARAAWNLETPGTQARTPGERVAHHGYPKLFVQIQDYMPDSETIREVALRDVVVLDAEMVANQPRVLGPRGTIRGFNPDAVILAYFSAADVIPWNTATINKGFIDGLNDAWYMKDTLGARYRLFEIAGCWTEMLNLTTDVNTFLPGYLADKVLAGGRVDGIFYDWIVEDVAWLNRRTPNPSGPLDINNDGTAEGDTELNALWVEGAKDLLANSRTTFPADALVVGNGGWTFDDTYRDVLNGRMVENFLAGAGAGGVGGAGGESLSPFGWSGVLRGHYLMDQVTVAPRVSLIMANGCQDDYEFMRFALASTLMFDGYFCYTNQGQYLSTWWYDEYSVDLQTGKAENDPAHKGYLGAPSGPAYSVSLPAFDYLGQDLAGSPSSAILAERNVWRRDFQNGIVLVNPTFNDKTVELGGTYRKILGLYDPGFNDGGTMSVITLRPRSGVVLLGQH